MTLERTTNQNSLEFLIVGQHVGFPKKRSLLQFEDLPSTCTHINWAKMYVYFSYSHKASFNTVDEAPYISRPLEVHQVSNNSRIVQPMIQLQFMSSYATCYSLKTFQMTDCVFPQVNKEWNEAEATRTVCMSGVDWSEEYLALDGSDANSNSLLCEPVTIYTSR